MPLHRLLPALAATLVVLGACARELAAPGAATTSGSRGTDPAPLPASFAYAGLSSVLLVSPTGLEFGEVPVGSTSAPQTVTITNITTTPVVMSVAGGEPPTVPFRGTTICNGLTLAPDASCQMSFTFAPTAAGFLEDVSSGTWNGQPFSIQLRGTGVRPRFRITPAALDFGPVQVGTTSPTQTVTVTNIGLAPVVMSNPTPSPSLAFDESQNCVGNTLAVGASCQMSFAYTPKAAGTQTAVSVGSWNGQIYSIALRGTGVSKFTISPTSLDFGEVVVGTTSATQQVTVTNSGVGPVVMKRGSAPFPNLYFPDSENCEGKTLAVGASCQMSFGFSPADPGTSTAVSVSSWNGQIYTIAVRGAGIASEAARTQPLLISPTALDFGDVLVGTTAPTQIVTMTNVSGHAFVMNGSGGNPATGRFGGLQFCAGVTLAPGASCQMSFAFSPNALGVLTDASIGSWSGQPFNIALRGNGVAPQFRISPTRLDFGDAQTGTVTATQPVTITNMNAVPIVMSGTGGALSTISFSRAQNCEGTTLAAGASCTMDFAFSPPIAGPLDDVSIGSWNGQSYRIDVHGQGTAPKFLVTPFALDFGMVPVGITGPAQNVRVTNAGVAPVVMNRPTAPPANLYFPDSEACQGITLAVGASCQMSFAFSPPAAGTTTAVSVSAWNGQIYTIAVRGTGFNGIAEYAMDLSPATISLTSTGTTSAVLLSTSSFDARTVTLANVRMLVNGTTDVSPVSRNGAVVTSTRDWNGDGLVDRMFSFQTSALVAAGLGVGAGPDALVLRDNLSAQPWRARDSAPPVFVP